MPLPILDGNQSATTLSTIFTSGAHIPAHTVVSLGAQAVSDISSAVSGISVSISGTQTTTFGAVSVSNFPSTQTVAGTVTANLGQALIDETGDVGSLAPRLVVGVYDVDGLQLGANRPFPISGTVTVGNSVTIGSLPAISGTVTANVLGRNANYTSGVTALQLPIIGYDETIETADAGVVVPVQITNTLGVVGGSNALPISGTVTVGNSVTIGSLPAISGTVTANVFRNSDITAQDGDERPVGSVNIGFYSDGDAEFRSVKSSQPLPISGTVTAAAPNGSLTTRFGTPTTANVSFATSAVTNANRKYLLIQNVTTGSNVITVGIGFTPTTTQGIQLTAGAGITFESSYIPTGAVYVLSSVTASNFTILEA